MYEFKKTGAILRLKMRQALGSKRVLMGYFLGFFIGFLKGLLGRRFFGAENLQIFEIYMILMNPFLEVSFVMLGYFMVIADAPFVNSLTQLSLLRSGRRAWFWAMLSYLAMQTAAYYGIVLLGTVLPNLLDGSFQDHWSEGVRFFIRFHPKAAIEEYGLIPFSEQVLKTWSPYEALGHGFLLICLYSYVLSCMMFVGNMCSEKPTGTMLAVGIHFLGVLFIKIGRGIGEKFSLLFHALLDIHVSGMKLIPLQWSYILFGICILLSYLWGKWLIKRVDFMEVSSERMW